MPRRSAGLLLYRGAPTSRCSSCIRADRSGPQGRRGLEHPKGEYASDEIPWLAATREFAEELGLPAPDGERIDLGEIRQSVARW
jgi:predicted NUDIX family NTP pyrophosphohydrolase